MKLSGSALSFLKELRVALEESFVAHRGTAEPPRHRERMTQIMRATLGGLVPLRCRPRLARRAVARTRGHLVH
eukprot:NODE_23302_length_672_cov_1.891743.p2 GENE.NODE_23302_length_672_cov_1.891743~~NODE_23302_length_672_cov_1.891743.p2  ORF type:complete len:73 (-),score=4.97 NODE_23302_length_672_cov_1.891743:30-248(-)